MTRTRMPRECKIAEQRLAMACDAAGLGTGGSYKTTKSGKQVVQGTDRCSYPAYGSPEHEEKARARATGSVMPGKPWIEARISHECTGGKMRVLVEITRNSTVGNPSVFTPGKAKGSYGYNYGKGSADAGVKRLWKNVHALARAEKLVDPITERAASEMLGIEGLEREHGTGIADGYVYGFNRYHGHFPEFGSKREAIAFGKRWKEGIDALVKRTS